MDFRFEKKTQEWLDANGYLGKCDEVVVAGGSRDIAVPIKEEHKRSLMRQIELSVKLHNPDEIVIIEHQDCGGYAQDNTIPSGLDVEEDRKQHIKFSKVAVQELKKKFPDRKYLVYYAPLTGPIEKLSE